MSPSAITMPFGPTYNRPSSQIAQKEDELPQVCEVGHVTTLERADASPGSPKRRSVKAERITSWLDAARGGLPR